ncbi:MULTISPECIES: DUF4280 domain-containing protein [unclassified Nostoc]|uniref:DUF4280 domain-containing protein n=1 Tax=unclassified Nostoc TaxID=2593658 RepID=UPI002AD48E34|nr:DUF4280 domain-containing protein [Nostoc sp. DedQUE03]MDZ7973104.1 DUF4280 domain-containing protein [Nostoc sp. DedQUE03]MDZ8046927.1 DUF4280 domain-containing protein [Nostoc sp. DedQUE02]
MPQQVVMGASLQCVPFGTAPSSLLVIPKGPPVMVNGMLTATIMDFAPFVNILPFGMCTSLTNPMVAAATTAALGVLTPMPCIPAILGPWKPGALKVKINNFPALPNTSICNCAWGGVVKINYAGQVKVNIT